MSEMECERVAHLAGAHFETKNSPPEIGGFWVKDGMVFLTAKSLCEHEGWTT